MDNGKAVYNFNVNSFNIKAEYYKRDIAEIFVPLVRRLENMRKSSDYRLIVYLAGPCGAGKTTLSLLLEDLIPAVTGCSAQSAGIDGFHYRQEYLNSHYLYKNNNKTLMSDVKGSAETYDFEKLHNKIKTLRRGKDIYWPGYDRIIHDTAEDVVFINGEIIIIEGNWLMLDEPRWRELAVYCDYSIFIAADRQILINRLIERKIKGGLSAKEAERFVMRSDAENIERILNHRLKCDLELEIKNDGGYKQ